MAMAMLSASSVFAYQWNYNVSGERIQSRNAAVGTIDAAYYNPSGLIQLKNGIYLDIGNRVLNLKKKSTGSGLTALGDTSVKSNQWGFMLPNLAIAYKNDRGAVFFTADIRDGGAGGDWKQGKGAAMVAMAITQDGAISATTESAKAMSFTLGYTGGVSFNLTDVITVSGAFRTFHKIETVNLNFNGTAGVNKIEITDTEYGFAPLLGIMITPLEGLNISLQWQGSSTLKGTIDTMTDGTSSKTATSNHMPDYFSLGVAYNVLNKLDIMLSYTAEFGGELKVNDIVIENENIKHVHKIGLGTQYRIMPAIAVSLGFMFQSTDVDDVNNVDFTNASYNQINVGSGVVITPLPNLNIEVGISNYIYLDSKASSGSAISSSLHTQNGFLMSLGFNYKI